MLCGTMCYGILWTFIQDISEKWYKIEIFLPGDYQIRWFNHKSGIFYKNAKQEKDGDEIYLTCLVFNGDIVMLITGNSE